ncbi:voltage-gated chloride channel protein [Coprobacillus sp. AF18-15LB]|nr:voltage-gated chloride channel protein [Coprobacillus sp. AF18-40]RGT85648.1 voltage-gated chloride channel protein [Coprobacillus sp. AF18-15LB]
MNKKTELIKYGVLALIIGIIVGIIDTIFGKGLILVGEIGNNYFWYLVPFLPIAGLLITWLYRHFNELSLKGMTLVFETGQQKRDAIPLALIPLVMICTWITHLFGGSAGREGVAVQIGATLSHYFSRYFHFPKNGKVLLITGMAAGFGGLFQTPLAALFFAIEVMIVGEMDYEALFPALIGAFSASYTSHFLGLEKFSVKITQTINTNDFKNIFLMIILGILFGLAGRLFSLSLAKLKEIFKKKFENPYKRIGFISILLVLGLMLFQGRYSGLGTNLIDLSFHQGTIQIYDWLLKLVFTIITLAIGFQGGEVTPLFSIGASLGIVLALIFHLPIELCAALGYVAVFASATNTLIAPMMISIEVFGGNNMMLFIIVCIFAYLVNGNQSIYGAQMKHLD